MYPSKDTINFYLSKIIDNCPLHNIEAIDLSADLIYTSK